MAPRPLHTARRWLIALLSVLLAGLPLLPAQAQNPLADWTILVYLDADNNLEREAIDDFAEMAAVGSNESVNVVVQFDRIGGYDARYGDWTGTLRFWVTPGMTPEPAYALADLGEANMGDPQTLVDFVRWGMAAFPARHTALVIWNHGDGWRTASWIKARRKAIAWDDTNGRDALDLVELGDALSDVTGGGAAPLDLLAFDACLMAMVEIDAQIRPYVRVRTASEETEPGTGYPFDAILSDLRAHPAWGPAELGRAIVERYYEAYGGETHSAVDLGAGYDELVAAVDALAGALLDARAGHMPAIQDARRGAQLFFAHYVDLYDLASRLREIEAPAVQQAAQRVMDAVEVVVLAEAHGSYWPGAHGITIYFPAQASGWDSTYAGENEYLSFTADTRWDDFVVAYLALAGRCDPDAYEPDNTPAASSPIGVDGKAQQHNFCPESDAADWVSFQARAGQRYQIATGSLASGCDTVLRLFDVDGATPLAQDDDGGPGWASRIEWTSPADGTYYVAASEYYGRSGPDTGYTVRIEALAVSVTGTVYLQGRADASGTLIAAQPLSQTATTDAAGSFALSTTLPSTLTATHPGYLAARWAITATAGLALDLPPVTLTAGDVNGDRAIDILDLAYVGAQFGGSAPRADLNGDGAVDILDVVMVGGNFGRRVW